MKTMKNAIRCLAVSSLLALAGCGSSPPVHFYTLEAIDTAVVEDEHDSLILAVGAIVTPEYLNRSQMVTRGPGAELIVDDFNRWAEPLDDAIHRVLASNLDVLLKSVIVVAYPPAAVLEIDYRVVGRFNRFDADEDGLVVLSVQWGMVDAVGATVVPPVRAQYEVQATRADDPGSIAQAMSDALGQYSRDVAGTIRAAGLKKPE